MTLLLFWWSGKCASCWICHVSHQSTGNSTSPWCFLPAICWPLFVCAVSAYLRLWHYNNVQTNNYSYQINVVKHSISLWNVASGIKAGQNKDTQEMYKYINTVLSRCIRVHALYYFPPLIQTLSQAQSFAPKNPFSRLLWHWSTWFESRCRVFGPYAPYVHWPYESKRNTDCLCHCNSWLTPALHHTVQTNRTDRNIKG